MAALAESQKSTPTFPIPCKQKSVEQRLATYCLSICTRRLMQKTLRTRNAWWIPASLLRWSRDRDTLPSIYYPMLNLSLLVPGVNFVHVSPLIKSPHHYGTYRESRVLPLFLQARIHGSTSLGCRLVTDSSHHCGARWVSTQSSWWANRIGCIATTQPSRLRRTHAMLQSNQWMWHNHSNRSD